MLKITTTLLMTFLVSCQSSYSTKLTCSRINAHQVKPHPMGDISFKFNRCRQRCFDMNSWSDLPLKTCKEFDGFTPKKIKREDGTTYEAVDFPLEACEGIAGFFLNPDIALDIRPNVKALHELKENICK